MDIATATHVLMDWDGTVLGVAFLAPILDTEREGSFLLTAAHCVRHLHNRSLPVRIQVAGGVDKECAVLLACDSEDLAVLYHPHSLGQPLPCSTDLSPGPVLIRGAPQGVITQQATLDGNLVGVEQESLDIVLPSLTYVEPTPRRKTPLAEGTGNTYRALRGLSGGPVVRVHADRTTRVIGLVTHRNTSGIANRIYGIPMDKVARILAKRGVVLRTAARLPAFDSDRRMLTGLISDMIRNPESDLVLWQRLSGLFYSGEPIDHILATMIDDPSAHGLHDELSIGRAEFVYARLQLKRERSSQALQLLDRARVRVRHADPADHSGMLALMNLRRLIEGPREGSLQEHAYRVESALDRLGRAEGLLEEDRAYEIASAAGREASLAYLQHPPPWAPNDPTASYYHRLREQHAFYLGRYRSKLLDKQEIVQIGLALVPAIWHLPHGAIADAAELASLGKIAAIQRQNAIFFCQMLLVEAVIARAKDSDLLAYTLACLVTQALRDAGLSLAHEGVAVLVRYIQATDPGLHRAIRLVHQLGIKDGVAVMYDKSDEKPHVIDKACRIASTYSDHLQEIKDIMTLRVDDMAE